MLKHRRAALICNLLMVALELYSLTICRLEIGRGFIRYYTEDSNLLALLGCGAMAFYQLRGKSAPSWARLLKYFAVCCLMQTFFVVLFVLIPSSESIAVGIRVNLMRDFMFCHHLVCPLLAFFSLIYLDEAALPPRAAALALIPTALYALVLIPLNLLRIVDGPYPFLRVYEQSVGMSIVWFIVMIGGAYLLARIVKRYSDKKS